MEKFIEKVSTYNILNNILPGIVFCYLVEKLFGLNMVEYSVIENLFIFYFIGMTINRVGSIIIEPICKKIGIVNCAPYGEFVNASKRDEKILVLLENSNLYRTMVALCILLLMVKLFLFFKDKFHCFSILSDWIVIVCIIILFVLAYKKQTKYIHDRINVINKE